jgi:hypothetical protein
MKKRKSYEKPEVRKVELLLSEIALGTGCDSALPATAEAGDCQPPGGACDLN